MKRIILLLLVAMLCLALCACGEDKLQASNPDVDMPTSGTTPSESTIPPEAYVGSEGLEYQSNGDGTCQVYGIGSCKDSNVKIPAVSPDGDWVTSIRNCAFQGCTSLASISISDSVTRIGENAFYGCTGLSSVTIPNSVVSIGSFAFNGCTSLSSITIPGSVTNMGVDVFHSCTGLESVTILDGATSIGIQTFWECTSLTSITIPDSVTSIGNYVFYECASLTNITIPDSVTTIGIGAFRGCASLTCIQYSGTVEQWEAIEKNNYWDYNMPNCTIYCNDGEISK